MKTLLIPMVLAASLFASTAHAQRGTLKPKPAKPEPKPVPVYQAGDLPASPLPQGYEQKLYGTHTPLVSSEQAEAVIAKFKEAYPKLGSPRFVIYVNRELVDEASGLKLTSRTEKTVEKKTAGPDSDTAQSSTIIRGANRMRVKEKPERDLADRQTVRDIERLFGRPFRMAGASLADQRVATQMIEGRSLVGSASTSEADQAARDREALAKTSDVAIEILISSKQSVVAEISGNRTYSVPDIQATAIGLKDAKILGQASSADLIGEGPAAGKAAKQYGVHEITEATALALMEDMAQEVQ